jgi:hypothetical protein
MKGTVYITSVVVAKSEEKCITDMPQVGFAGRQITPTAAARPNKKL